jgi:uncharacterized protein (DUF2141 family)
MQSMLTTARRCAKCLAWLFAGVVAVGGETVEVPQTASLTVVVTNSRSNKGKMHFALFDSPKGFTDNAIDGGAVVIKDRKAEWMIKKLKPGEYAIACYHDENGDGKFNQNFIGIPLENYGFSNEARAGLGPPSWKKVVFTVKPGANRHVIRIRKK